MTEKREITIEDIQSYWEEDSKIDESVLNEELCRTPSLHSKYLRYFIQFSKKLVEYRTAYNKLGFMKRKYYKGECTQEELKKFNWVQYQGLKLNGVSEMAAAMEHDLDLIMIKQKISEYELSVKTIERILNNIGYRDSSLKTLYEYNKYISGS